MKTRISALMDGELEDHEVADTLNALRRDEALRADWAAGHLIGAALRHEGEFAVDVTARVMAALDLEPTVLAPQPRRVDWQRPALALAASAAGVAVVAWLGLGALTVPAGSAAGLAALKTEPARMATHVAGAATVSATPRIQEYLVAHQAYAPGGAITGGARNNIRTVAMAGHGQ